MSDAEGDNNFVTTTARGSHVRCVTYRNYERVAFIDLDPDRAEAFAGQLLTEAARVRARKGALDEAGPADYGGRQQ